MFLKDHTTKLPLPPPQKKKSVSNFSWKQFHKLFRKKKLVKLITQKYYSNL